MKSERKQFKFFSRILNLLVLSRRIRVCVRRDSCSRVIGHGLGAGAVVEVHFGMPRMLEECETGATKNIIRDHLKRDLSSAFFKYI